MIHWTIFICLLYNPKNSVNIIDKWGISFFYYFFSSQSGWSCLHYWKCGLCDIVGSAVSVTSWKGWHRWLCGKIGTGDVKDDLGHLIGRVYFSVSRQQQQQKGLLFSFSLFFFKLVVTKMVINQISDHFKIVYIVNKSLLYLFLYSLFAHLIYG